MPSKHTPRILESIQRGYLRGILSYLGLYEALVTREIMAAIPGLKKKAQAALPITLKMDATDDTLSELFAKVQKRLDKAAGKNRLKALAEGMVDKTSKASKETMSAHFRSASRKLKAPAEIEPLLTDKGLSDYFKERVASNVSLIKSIPEELHPKLRKKVSFLMAKDATVKQIGDAIREHFEVSKRRAAFIARDQVNKLNGELDQHRQTQMGVERYRWRTMNDMRVTGRPGGMYPDAKPSHWKREGKIYSWSKPPEGGHPRVRPGCRCYAEPVLDDILD